MKKYIIYVVGLIFTLPVIAAQDQERSFTTEEWQAITDQVNQVEGTTALLPSLLPFIMENRDALQMTKEQVQLFRDWRDKNYVNMVDTMNEIIALKLQFRTESMSPNVSKEYLIEVQSRIHELQRELLNIRLSCREILVGTFTKDQWENFAFIASDHPKYASLFTKQGSLYPYISYEKWLAQKHSEIAPAAGSTVQGDKP